MKKLLILTLMYVATGCSLEGEDQKSNSVAKYRQIEEGTIINLYDAFGENIQGMTKDFGFSCIVKYRGLTILFDGGTNADILKKNAEALKIDLSTVDIAVASHAHFDHINGFDYLLKINPEVKIYFPYDIFWGANMDFDLSGTEPSISDSLERRMQYFDGDYRNYSSDQTGRFWNAKVEFVAESFEIKNGIKLITTRSDNMGYFNNYPTLEDCDNCDTPLARYSGLNELSLSLETEGGEILFVGCSHSTVEKIIDSSKAFTGNDIELLFGGYHLLPYDRPTLNNLALRLKNDHGIRKVAPAHCTGHLAFKILQDTFGENYIFAGLGEEVKF